MGGPSAFGIYMFIYALVFPYIFLLVDCFEWALIDNIEQWRVHSVLWQFWMGGPSAFGIYMFIYALVFLYIFLLVDCFEWALIDDIEQQRVHTVLWQFWMGGVNHQFYLGKSENLISQMFRCAHQKGLFALHKTNESIRKVTGLLRAWN